MSTDTRLSSTMGMMARDSDHEAVVALRQATRMLAQRGLDWLDVAALAIGATRGDAGRTRADAPPRQDPRPRPAPATGNVRVQGHDIPQVVLGEVVITRRERTNSGGRRLVFHLRDRGATYGPIVAFRKIVTDVLEGACRDGRPVMATMLSRGEGTMAGGGAPFMPQAGHATTNY